MTLEEFAAEIDEAPALFGLDEFVDIVRALYWADQDEIPEELDELSDRTIAELWDERKVAKGLVAAAKKCLEVVDSHITKKLGPAGVVRLDDYKVNVSTEVKYRISDPIGFAEWVGGDWEKVFNFNEARSGALKQIAIDRGEDPATALDSFYEEVPGKTKLATVPLKNVGKKWSEMEHGKAQDSLEE